ncbi:phage integrase [Rhodovulum sulfidophilum]|uniref:Phage integrase n=1 Tax=Rhodovulum sulfidophilum TaxID=35806 RepID=A0A0D6AY45_RHOSU|nr:phage integrase [Rhodovulum sulfidophilum]
MRLRIPAGQHLINVCGSLPVIEALLSGMRAVQLPLGHTKMDRAVRYLGVEFEDALAISVAAGIKANRAASKWATLGCLIEMLSEQTFVGAAAKARFPPILLKNSLAGPQSTSLRNMVPPFCDPAS